jgi:hypothetical protein
MSFARTFADRQREQRHAVLAGEQRYRESTSNGKHARQAIQKPAATPCQDALGSRAVQITWKVGPTGRCEPGGG